MGYYPIILDIAGERCLIVGGGTIAARKAERLAECGAVVTVIAPEISGRIRDICGIALVERPFEAGDTQGFRLVYAASDDPDVNTAVSEEAKSRGALVNAVDEPEKCNFIAPSVVQRGDLMIAVSTSGKSPSLSKRLRAELEKQYGPEYAELLELMGEMRVLVKSKYAHQSQRQKVFDRLLDSGILELLREGKREAARERAMQCI